MRKMTIRRRRSRARANYYASKRMKAVDRVELRRAGKVEGLSDEIALFRMQLKRSLDEDGEKLDVLAASVETLARAVRAQHRVSPTGEMNFLERHEQALTDIAERVWPEVDERRRQWAEIYDAEWRARQERERAEEGDSGDLPAEG